VHRPDLLWWLPVLFAGVYGLVVLVNFGAIITSINLNGDAVVAPVIGKLLGSAPAGTYTTLGNHAWYEELLYLQATRNLPSYRQLWDITPLLWSLLALGLVVWACWRALGAWPAAIAGSALVCVGELGRFCFLSFDWHVMALLHTTIVAAALVWLAPRAHAISWPRMCALAVVLGLLSAFSSGSDELFTYWALVPLLGTAVLVAWRTAGPVGLRVLAFAVIVSVLALGGGSVFAAVMRDNGFHSVPLPLTFVTADKLVGNITLLFEGYPALGGGYFLGLPLSKYGAAVFVSGMLVLGALILTLVEVRRLVARAAPRSAAGERRADARFVYIAFWTISLLTTSAAFVFSSAPVDIVSARYLLAGYVAVGALLPLLALRGPGWRVLTTAGVCAFAAAASYQVIRQPFTNGSRFPEPSAANSLARFAKQEAVSTGYAGYWDAADLTWLTYLKVKVYPVYECSPPSHSLCQFGLVHVASWYTPRPNTRSLLIVDQTQPYLAAPDPALGRPLAVRSIEHLTVYVYPYDIAAKIAPPPS